MDFVNGTTDPQHFWLGLLQPWALGGQGAEDWGR